MEAPAPSGNSGPPTPSSLVSTPASNSLNFGCGGESKCCCKCKKHLAVEDFYWPIVDCTQPSSLPGNSSSSRTTSSSSIRMSRSVIVCGQCFKCGVCLKQLDFASYVCLNGGSLYCKEHSPVKYDLQESNFRSPPASPTCSLHATTPSNGGTTNLFTARISPTHLQPSSSSARMLSSSSKGSSVKGSSISKIGPPSRIAKGSGKLKPYTPPGHSSSSSPPSLFSFGLSAKPMSASCPTSPSPLNSQRLGNPSSSSSLSSSSSSLFSSSSSSSLFSPPRPSSRSRRTLASRHSMPRPSSSSSSSSTSSSFVSIASSSSLLSSPFAARIGTPSSFAAGSTPTLASQSVAPFLSSPLNVPTMPSISSSSPQKSTSASLPIGTYRDYVGPKDSSTTSSSSAISAESDQNVIARMRIVREQVRELLTHTSSGERQVLPLDTREELPLVKAKLAMALEKLEQAEKRALEAEQKAALSQLQEQQSNGMLENMMSLMDEMEAKYRASDDSSKQMEAMQRETAEAKTTAETLKAQLSELQKTSERQEKELARLKGTDLKGCTLEELTQLEAVVENCRKKIADARLLLQIADQETRKKECVLCMDQHKQSVFVPCGHLACCNKCAKQVTKCPVCRQDIAQVVPVYDC